MMHLEATDKTCVGWGATPMHSTPCSVHPITPSREIKRAAYREQVHDDDDDVCWCTSSSALSARQDRPYSKCPMSAAGEDNTFFFVMEQ